MFSLINVGERSGTGLCDLFNVWEESGFKKPTIQETIDPDRITLTLQIETYTNDGNHDGNSDGNLSEIENDVLSAIRTAPNQSARKIAEHIGVSEKTVERAIRTLKQKDNIKREGSTRGKWIILK